MFNVFCELKEFLVDQKGVDSTELMDVLYDFKACGKFCELQECVSCRNV